MTTNGVLKSIRYLKGTYSKLYFAFFFFFLSFSMTLVDSLDTLAIIGDYDEFEHAVKLVIDNVKLDNDIIVSVFETNIRMVG